jgi:hypothetical protein
MGARGFVVCFALLFVGDLSMVKVKITIRKLINPFRTHTLHTKTSINTTKKANGVVPGGEFWAIDTDLKALAACEAPHTVHIPPDDDDAPLPPAELRRISGGGAAPVPKVAPGAMPTSASAGEQQGRACGAEMDGLGLFYASAFQPHFARLLAKES